MRTGGSVVPAFGGMEIILAYKPILDPFWAIFYTNLNTHEFFDFFLIYSSYFGSIKTALHTNLVKKIYNNFF